MKPPKYPHNRYTALMTQRVWRQGDRVKVTVSEDHVLPGRISQVMDPGPYKPWLTLKVQFNDPLVMGGTGTGWFSTDAVVPE